MRHQVEVPEPAENEAARVPIMQSGPAPPAGPSGRSPAQNPPSALRAVSPDQRRSGLKDSGPGPGPAAGQGRGGSGPQSIKHEPKAPSYAIEAPDPSPKGTSESPSTEAINAVEPSPPPPHPADDSRPRTRPQRSVPCRQTSAAVG
jgi:hypothetical protein